MFSMTEYIEARTHDRTSEREYYNVENEKFAFDMKPVLRFPAEQTVHGYRNTTTHYTVVT